MNPSGILAALLLPLVCSAGPGPELRSGKSERGSRNGEKIEWQVGKCQGGNRPSTACKTCERCDYCGKKPSRSRPTPRPGNSATCAVCAASK